jgi:hypothetical protein
MPEGLRISDHAVLRYLERAGGFEIEALRQALQNRVARSALPGAASVLIDGFRFVLKDTPDGLVVVTVVPKDQRATVFRPEVGE